VKKWVWFPLSMGVFGSYAIQRGLTAFSKVGTGIPLDKILSIYFLVVMISALGIGILLDNIQTRKVFLVATIVGALGLLLLPYTLYGFGILFGAAATMMKLAPFSSPMKLYSENEGWKIAPQAASKFFGTAFFLLLLGGGVYLTEIGWNWTAFGLSLFFLLAGVVSLKHVPDNRIEGWKLDKLQEWIKKPVFWSFMSYHFIMTGFHYVLYSKWIPSLETSGYDRDIAVLLLGIAAIFAGLLRWPTARVGDKYGYWIFCLIGVVMFPVLAYVAPSAPLVWLIIYIPIAAGQTPNYWGWAKRITGPEHVSTLMGIGVVFQYLGSFIIYGRYTW